MTSSEPLPSPGLDLLLRHADRTAQGALEHPADVAAVVGVERVACLLGSTDAATLRAAIQHPQEAGVDHLVDVVHQVLDRVDTGLLRGDDGRRPTVASINPEAGVHHVVDDAGLLRAGTRAAHATLEANAYYRLRYGTRGLTWAVGDSSWLLGHMELSLAQALHQVLWLSRLLAARGMPSWLMEQHLGALVQQVEEAGYDPGALPEVAQALREQRAPFVDDALLADAAGWVADAVEEPPAPHAGWLIAAAEADVLTGLISSSSPVLDWFTDPARTSPVDAATLRDISRKVVDAAGSPHQPRRFVSPEERHDWVYWPPNGRT